ncbi:MAG: endopeptidase [Thermoanaerobaculia bacterium]|nr:endopeptidase [Thermoanaerobaculia bacterium]
MRKGFDNQRFPNRAAWMLAALVCVIAASGVWALQPKEGSYLSAKEFFLPELYISSANEALDDVIYELPNQAAWEQFQSAAGLESGDGQMRAFIDPRSGAATNVLGAFPLIPGRGVGNQLTLGDLGRRLGSEVRKVDSRVVGEAVLGFVRARQEVLGIDLAQLGSVRVGQVTPELWQVSIPQVFQGVPVRHGRLAATINNGNLILLGTETWGNVSAALSPAPKVSSEKALALGFEFAGGRVLVDELVQQPKLEIIPFAPPEFQIGEGYGGQIGKGYGHRLAWVFAFVRPPDSETWEVMVDAHSGQVIAFQDVTHYLDGQIKGGVYPITSTEICPNADQCGTMQSGWPMPYADTGLASPNNFTNSAGIFNYTSGTVTTTLTGRFFDIVDNCGAVSNSSTTGVIDMGGVTGHHNCTTGGGGAGNTAASRTAFYELNKLAELARGWLPSNTWLNSRVTTNVNINNTCNAFYSAGTVNFYRSGGGCRNTGEIAGVFDHEWGHALDDNDTGGNLSSTSEGYADIVAIYRLEASCVGHGFFDNSSSGSCGLTVDGTGRNCNEALTGSAVCCTDCSGVRDADYAKHTPNTPATALGFVCPSCTSSTGPCGRQVHCAGAPIRQAAWDFVTRDLTAAPFNLDSQTAFIIGNKVFYQGSGNIGAWYTCTCTTSSGGCGSTNGYMQWLAADDDNGNVNDGTPHMTALYNAFNRHGIACATPTPTNSGCSGGPSAAATLSATAGDKSVALSWGTVSGATRYWVFRSEGHAGCNFGKTLIAEVTGTSYTDTQVANGREYYYNVVAAGSSSACFGRASNCVNVTPAASVTPDFNVACSPSSVSAQQGGTATSTCTVSSVNGFSSAVTLSCAGQPAGVSCGFSSNPVTPPANGSSNSTLTLTVGGSQATGTFNFNVQGVSGATTKTSPISLTVTAVGGGTVFFDDFETNQGWTVNPNGTDTATTGQWERGNPQGTNSSGAKQLDATVSGVNDLVTGASAGSTAGASTSTAG